MNTSLTRTQFVDRILSPDDLQWIATMLADWYQSIKGHLPALTVTLNLWGSAAQDEETLCRQVQEYAASLGVPLTGFPLTPPPGALAPPIGHLMSVFQDPALQNLVVEIRLNVGGEDSRTLVLYGYIENGGFLIKALWPAGRGDFQEAVYSHTAWPHEAQFFNALVDYRNGQRAVPEWTRLALFPDPANRSWLSGLTWFLSPQDGRGVRGFLVRVALAGVVFGVSLWGVLISLHAPPSFLMPAIPGVILGGLGLVYTLGWKTVMIQRTLTRMRAGFRAIYSRPIAYPVIDLASIPGALQDPAVRKVSAEITALGGQHYQDITIEPATTGHAWIRLYLFPEEATVFTVMFMYRTDKFRIFPTKPTFLLRTNLRDDYRLISTSGGNGYRKPLPLPVISRTYPDVKDPAEMLQRHRAAFAQVEQAGRTRVPLQPEHLIEQMIAEHEQNGEALAKYG